MKKDNHWNWCGTVMSWFQEINFQINNTKINCVTSKRQTKRMQQQKWIGTLHFTLKHQHHNARCKIRGRLVQLLYRRHSNECHKVCNKNSQHETPNLVHALPIPMNWVPYHIEHIVVMKTIYKMKKKKKTKSHTHTHP